MVNQQKVVQQETAYSAVVVNDHNILCIPVPAYIIFFKNDMGTGVHMIIHYIALLFADLPSLSPFI